MADVVNNDAGADSSNGPPTPQGSKETPPAEQQSPDLGVAADDINDAEAAPDTPESAEDAACKEQSAVPPETSKEQSDVPPAACTRRVYSKHAMQAIFTGMGLPQLTMAPAWEEGVLDAWPDTHGPIATELPELIGNLHRCQTLLEGAEPGIPVQGYNRPTQRRSYTTSWTPRQQAAAFNAAYATYAAAGHAAAIAASAQLPRHIRPIRVVPNQAPAHTSAHPSPFNAAAMRSDQDVWAGSTMCSLNGSHRAQSSSGTPTHAHSCTSTPMHAHSSTPTPTAARESLASTATVSGSAGWEASIKKLLGLQDGSSTSWLVQSPHITGSMGPIPAEGMAAWLLQGVTPRQLGRECHKPLVYATAADPASLLVCGLMAGELERGIKPGRNAFKPLRELLPALASGMDYSTAVKDVVWNRQGSAEHTASAASRAFTSTTSLGSSFSRGDLGTLASMEPNSVPLPDTPTASVNTPTSSQGGDSFSLKSCTVPQLVSHLQQLPAGDTAGLTAAAKEIRDRARNNMAARELLVQGNVVPALVSLLQMPLLSEGQPQVAAAWALYYCMGRSKATPQGCPEAAAAMDAVGAVKHATAVLKAVWKQAGSSGTFSEPLQSCRLERSASTTGSACASASTSPTQDSTKPEQQEANEESDKAARVQEAAVAVLAGLASTSSGKQAMLDEGGAIPSIVRLLGSRCPRVMSAAVSTVRNLSDQGTFPVYTALFKAGASAMLVHVVSSNAEPACKQTALRVLLDLATAALSSTPEPADTSASAVTATSATEAKQSAEEFTTANAVDRLVRRGLPVVLLKLLHTDPPLALQARAMKVLQLLAAHKPEEVLGSIRDLVSAPADGKDEGISLTGVQLLQRLMRSTSNTVKEVAVELLQALADAGMVGRGPRRAK